MYQKINQSLYTGRQSNKIHYLHEKIKFVDLDQHLTKSIHKPVFSILGYCCDEGVKRNKGRAGAAAAPDMIRKMISPLANHFPDSLDILDFGNIYCDNKDLEKIQTFTSGKIQEITENQIFNIILGGGHDLAYAHFNGLKNAFPKKKIGIINLDAHFDLRAMDEQGTSGTPFYQIASENPENFQYLCLGIQKESNHKELFSTAEKFGVKYLYNQEFVIQNYENVSRLVDALTSTVDLIYLSIDLDGFSSAIAPGVSAPSPLGFQIDIVVKVIEDVIKSEKLVACDIVELNPTYDIDNTTARLAARLLYKIFELKISQIQQ
ncbi:formimidoylglutamase [Aquimarina brevivitae]|uniref:Formimidoylglutamase n=1 Tax=Aquimarina brevivitae TaxID=323412 RepID=A0A4Q7NU23_9FLAO|nr:formimidoylglutamase [Aquimarina brevivitae]RZS90683.1 formiminoglutamase [Aquimarina brevivitae]